jgi:hypothetical protein
VWSCGVTDKTASNREVAANINVNVSVGEFPQAHSPLSQFGKYYGQI